MINTIVSNNQGKHILLLQDYYSLFIVVYETKKAIKSLILLHTEKQNNINTTN